MAKPSFNRYNTKSHMALDITLQKYIGQQVLSFHG